MPLSAASFRDASNTPLSNISKIKAREVLDSRGNPTVEVDVELSDGARGSAQVPSGASTGSNEALELRDSDPKRFQGRGVLTAIRNVHDEIAPELIGRPAQDQQAIDSLLTELDGTPNKARLGANALLGVSMALAYAAAHSGGKPLYDHLTKGNTPSIPVPMLNIINGGRHAEDSTDFQEFMVVPAGFDTFKRALQAGVEVYHELRSLLSGKGLGTTVGDEGGFAPPLESNSAAVELVLAAIEKAGYIPGSECFIALDVAASELVLQDGRYNLAREKSTLSRDELEKMYKTWVDRYPIVSIEDGMAEEDWEGWRDLTSLLGEKVQLVGDDLYATDTGRIRKGIELGASNAVLIKPNQIGTLTETLEAVAVAQKAGWGTVISHRSGETEASAIADLAVGTASGQIKAGAPARGERTAKYNRLLRIEEELGEEAVFAGQSVYEKFVQRG